MDKYILNLPVILARVYGNTRITAALVATYRDAPPYPGYRTGEAKRLRRLAQASASVHRIINRRAFRQEG